MLSIPLTHRHIDNQRDKIIGSTGFSHDSRTSFLFLCLLFSFYSFCFSSFLFRLFFLSEDTFEAFLPITSYGSLQAKKDTIVRAEFSCFVKTNKHKQIISICLYASQSESNEKQYNNCPLHR